nr:hypothetical protein Itr_chr11CG07900 [Ipomoea trifida]
MGRWRVIVDPFSIHIYSLFAPKAPSNVFFGAFFRVSQETHAGPIASYDTWCGCYRVRWSMLPLVIVVLIDDLTSPMTRVHGQEVEIQVRVNTSRTIPSWVRLRSVRLCLPKANAYPTYRLKGRFKSIRTKNINPS